MQDLQAIIKTGGKQYIVTKGDKILVEKLGGDAGAEVTFDQVLMVTGDQVKIGAPLVSGAKVAGKILSQEKAKKVIAFKYKRRKGYHKTKGHRQQLTRVEITGIQG
ncbi:MAG: 50S ribosomal protein L21 [Deltaproteobacteria bacterium]|nr:50S ribosomal protein L21 [Deltaproteobacteria bacterium]